jgi:hypothetical protein
MPSVKFKQPCNDCPYRRDAIPGWLGDGDAQHFIDGALADFAEFHLPCHLTIDYEDRDWKQTQYPDAAFCAGALIFYRNVDEWKLPRDRERSEAVAQVEPDHERVFSSPEGFRQHHETNEGRREWLERRGLVR